VWERTPGIAEATNFKENSSWIGENMTVGSVDRDFLVGSCDFMTAVGAYHDLTFLVRGFLRFGMRENLRFLKLRFETADWNHGLIPVINNRFPN